MTDGRCANGNHVRKGMDADYCARCGAPLGTPDIPEAAEMPPAAFEFLPVTAEEWDEMPDEERAEAVRAFIDAVVEAFQPVVEWFKDEMIPALTAEAGNIVQAHDEAVLSATRVGLDMDEVSPETRGAIKRAKERQERRKEVRNDG